MNLSSFKFLDFFLVADFVVVIGLMAISFLLFNTVSCSSSLSFLRSWSLPSSSKTYSFIEANWNNFVGACIGRLVTFEATVMIFIKKNSSGRELFFLWLLSIWNIKIFRKALLEFKYRIIIIKLTLEWLAFEKFKALSILPYIAADVWAIYKTSDLIIPI